MGSVWTVVPSRAGNQRTSSSQEIEEGGGGWLWTPTKSINSSNSLIVQILLYKTDGTITPNQCIQFIKKVF